ncbi:Germacrene A synthase [Pleurostoma richardsiae]|uniref:Terpene synthase n=1 Tax=Pleurostoma richardsiae TaxID=41990 RepID=A0AA38S7G6_9PEZI|nr:Germacrene A synthase [Pleurostoma richardsiae]
MEPKIDVNALLAAGLRGRTMHVPNMLLKLQDWPHGKRNKHYLRLRKIVDEILTRVIPDPKRCQKFKDGDFAIFCCIWWPEAEWEELYTAALFTVWAFIWDDTIDTNEDILSDDFEKACVFRTQSLSYVRYWLGLTSQGELEPICPSPASAVFKDFGKRYTQIFSQAKCQRFFDEVKLFFKHSEMEQAERLAGHVPDYNHYMGMRHGVTAVRIFVLLLEVVHRINLPKWIMDSAELNAVVTECNHCIIIINDILSLKKELVTNCVISAVPVLFFAGKPLDTIVNLMMTELEDSRDRLNTVEAKLNHMTRDNPSLNENVMVFVNGCRLMDTGTLEYTTLVKRYDVLKYVQPDGSLDIVL